MPFIDEILETIDKITHDLSAQQVGQFFIWCVLPTC
jgi:hypothetical protein